MGWSLHAFRVDSFHHGRIPREAAQANLRAASGVLGLVFGGFLMVVGTAVRRFVSWLPQN